MSQCNVCVPKKTLQKVVHKSVAKECPNASLSSKFGVLKAKIRNGGSTTISSPEYCWKLNTIIDRPLGTICSEHSHCDEGLECSDGVCSVCPKHVCPDRTQSDKLSAWGKTCKYGEYNCPDPCLVVNAECNDLRNECCRGLICDGEKCITDTCKKSGDCRDDRECCANYGCLNDTVMHAVGQECYSENGQASPNCVGGTFCDTDTNKCYISYEAPRAIYNPVGHDCMYHFDCEEGLYCAQDPTRDGRKICSTCLLGEECPDKGSPNLPTCKRGEYGCHDVCLHEKDQCRTTDIFGKTIKVGDCCRGMMCGVTGYCVNDERKMTGMCTDDNECADKYGCLNGTVVYAEGQICSSENTKASPSCTGGTICNTDTGTCSRPTGTTRVTYNSWLYMPCGSNRDDDCDIGLYCSGMCQNCANKEGGCTEKAERNIRRCKFRDDKCLGRNKCVTFGATKVEGFSCCRGLKENNEGKYTTCKKSGVCNKEDDDICAYYGCMDNKVVYAQQIKCETVDDCPRNDYNAFNDKIICKSKICIDPGYERPAHYIEH